LVQTDVWIWHLLRRAQGHSAARTHRLMTQAIERLLREDTSTDPASIEKGSRP
jgi:hypothetical protein